MLHMKLLSQHVTRQYIDQYSQQKRQQQFNHNEST